MHLLEEKMLLINKTIILLNSGKQESICPHVNLSNKSEIIILLIQKNRSFFLEWMHYAYSAVEVWAKTE